MSDKIKPHHLERKSVVYVRQSSPYQVAHNEESRRLQYAMRARLEELGWREIDVVDDDLGCTARGVIVRTGFDRMVADVCLGKVGAVATRELSRFARNNRE
jgi:DNA invertase Pin-like site-specific DNA recombinase